MSAKPLRRAMRAAAVALSLLLLAALLIPAATGEDFAAEGKVNKLLSIRETPSLAPGESGRLAFFLNSTYTEPVRNVTLKASIYEFATIDESIPVDGSWPYSYPRIAENTGNPREWAWTAPVLANGSSVPLNFTVLTAASSQDMPHGSIFSQSSYFVRFRLNFTANVGGNETRFLMVGRGYFTTAQFNSATVPQSDPCNLPDCRGRLNLTMLASFLGVSRVDGVIPDTGFGVKEPIPRWPFYALIVLAVAFLLLAFLYWVEENPGSYPRIEAWWARTRGRLARTTAPLHRVRRPRG
jgi:hypothetical protein